MEFDKDEIIKKIESFRMEFPIPERKIIIRTGVGGMELFEERMEESVGLKRIYIGKKCLRILRKLKTPIKKSHLTGRYYKLTGWTNFSEQKEGIELIS